VKAVRPGGHRASLGRRTFVCGALAGAGASSALASPLTLGASNQTDWLAFRDRFILADGRVIDTGNDGVSHTEGQGWGLLFAEYFNEREKFEQILSWTFRNLRRPHDALHAWRYRPANSDPVSDYNNATDGDVFIAWALARAAQRWQVPEHAQAAAAIARDILRLVTVRRGDNLLLLPGSAGFEKPENVVVNPSYYVFPAFAALARMVPSASWAELQHDGLSLIERGRFGRWMLPPDWLQIAKNDGALAPAVGWPPRCSFDAIRVPLYLIWAGLSSPVVGAFAAFYEPRAGTPPPAWTNLDTQESAPYPAPLGMLAVAQAAAAVTLSSAEAIEFPKLADAPDYYSAALTLLVRIAWAERHAA
jgi:endo-1,4-beta-D-glucanase Y